MKGLTLIGLMELVILFVAVILVLSPINTVINQASSYMDASQIIAAGLIGLVLIIAVLSKFFRPSSPQYDYPQY